MKRFDLPPVWLLGFVALAWVQAKYLPMRLGFGGSWSDFLGGLMVGGGIVLTVLAVSQFRKHRTTINPHDTPSALIQSGIFSRTRNPIYLADALILAGFILWFNAVLSLPLIPIFVYLIERRFIFPEEFRMRNEFGAEFSKYETQSARAGCRHFATYASIFGRTLAETQPAG